MHFVFSQQQEQGHLIRSTDSTNILSSWEAFPGGVGEMNPILPDLSLIRQT